MPLKAADDAPFGAFRLGQKAEPVMRDMGSGKGRDLGMVEGRRDLHQIHANKIEPAEPTDKLQRLPGGKTARDGCAGAGREGRIKRVDVE